MKNKQIVFTAPCVAELLEKPMPVPQRGEVLVKKAFSTISAGTERANLIGDPNISPSAGQKDAPPMFPRELGYCSAGTVAAVGEGVTDLAVGDRVVCVWGVHAAYQVYDQKDVVKIEYDDVPLNVAATCFIATFPLTGLRKTQPELGESGMVVGLGVLGIFAVQIAKVMGLAPVIAVDPVESRRAFALKMGADYALDPTAPDYVATVKKLTGGGVNVAVEVTGNGKALDQTLDCMAKFGRVSLLGCTRNSDFTIDYYRKVHYPGISLIGAHTRARPKLESRPGAYTHQDDLKTLLRLLHGKRLDFAPMITEVHSPKECGEVFARLATDKDFPVGVQFDWSKLEDENK